MGLPKAVGIHSTLDKLNDLPLKDLTQAKPKEVLSPALPPTQNQARFRGKNQKQDISLKRVSHYLRTLNTNLEDFWLVCEVKRL